MALTASSLDLSGSTPVADIFTLANNAMTARYTDGEWATLVAETCKVVVPSKESYPVPPLDNGAFPKYIDHTLLKLDATGAQVDALCSEARTEGFRSVCVRLNHVPRAVSNLKGCDVVVACVVGFHEGTQDTYEKLKEAQAAVAAGASELDVVLNHPLLACSSPAYSTIYNELASLRSLLPSPTILKLIVETSALSPFQIVTAAHLASAARFDFIKTSTGFAGHGATVEDVRLMRGAAEYLGESEKKHGLTGKAKIMEVKASGGIRELDDCLAMMKAGATRIGTSSGVWIMQEARRILEERNGKGNGNRRPGGGVTRLYTDSSIDGY